MSYLNNSTEIFDVILLDPPYELKVINECVKIISEKRLLFALTTHLLKKQFTQQALPFYHFRYNFPRSPDTKFALQDSTAAPCLLSRKRHKQQEYAIKIGIVSARKASFSICSYPQVYGSKMASNGDLELRDLRMILILVTIIMANVPRNQEGFDLEFHELTTYSGEGSVLKQINSFYEDFILKSPASFLWMHRRFKNRPEGQKPVYSDWKRRDIKREKIRKKRS